MESSHCPPRRNAQWAMSAQRLAASMESSHPTQNEMLTYADRCSTPCGINGILTGYTTYHPPCPGVLNALRHQWNPHNGRLMRSHASRRAQRLAASMESSHPLSL